VAFAGHTGDLETARQGLTHPEGGVRATALGALERLGALTDDELRQAFDDTDAPVRRRAAELAARHAGVDLLPVLGDSDASVVEAAAWACGERHEAPDAVLAALVDLATGGREPLIRESAVAALGALGDERGLDAILAGTRDKPAIRRRAVLALAPFVGPDHARADEIDEALQHALTDRDWQVRQAAEDVMP
jgi:HEAT repeat protein